MGSLIKIMQYALVAPMIVQLVMVLVHLFEVEGNGEAKKQAVLETIDMIYVQVAALLNLKVPADFVKTVAANTIDIAVKFYNLIGLFTSKKQEPSELVN